MLVRKNTAQKYKYLYKEYTILNNNKTRTNKRPKKSNIIINEHQFCDISKKT